MNNIKFATLHYASRLKYLVAVIIFVWILSYIFSSFGGSSRSTRLVAPFPMSHQQLAYNSTIAKTIEYCNPAHTIKAVDEGISPVKRGKLEYIGVVIRHGDRSPLSLIQNQFSIKCHPEEGNIINDYLRVFRSMTPKFPFYNITAYPPDKKCGNIGQLTWIGALQHVILGQELREAYIEKHELLRSWSHDQLSVMSTTFRRTYQSAMAFLYGFLKTTEIFDIEIKEAESHRFCFTDALCPCPQLFAMDEHFNEVAVRSYETHPKMSVVFNRVSSLTYWDGYQKAADPFITFDALMGYICHSHPLPCKIGMGKCLNYFDTHLVLNFYQWHVREIKKELGKKFSRKYALLSMQGFLTHVLDEINATIFKRKQTRFALYSGHDVTVELVLNSLGIDGGVTIPYASRVIFEVYAFQRLTLPEHAIKVIYNGDDVTPDVWFCKKSFSDSFKKSNPALHKVCLLKNFEDYIANGVKDFGFSSFRDACEA